MNADEVMKRAIAYGVDEEGIRDRFGGDAELYELCLRDFLEEPNLAALEAAMNAGDRDKAFAAAHALKGLSGNLGLTAVYRAVCALVEVLRTDSCDAGVAEYGELLRRFNELLCAFSDTPPAAVSPSAGRKKQAPAPKKKRDRYVLLSLALLVAALMLVVFLFCRISVNYRQTIVQESAQHLTEICRQIRFYVEARIDTDWEIGVSVGDSVLTGNYTDNDGTMALMLARKRESWGVTDLMLLTANGSCLHSDGGVELDDAAAETAATARRLGRYMSVVDSRIVYTVPVATELRYRGSRIVAVSVVQDMATLLDNMELTSFNDEAWMYLTEEDGTVISMLSNAAAVAADNFHAVTEGLDIKPLTGEGPVEDYLAAEDTETYILSGGPEPLYMISAPISAGPVRLHLFYLVPEAAVNRSMNDFSRQLTIFSLAILVLFGVLAFLLFLRVYTGRKKMFDQAILTRERMFDLLVKNTRTAFGLFRTGQPEPVYVSGNAIDVVGDRFWAIDRTESGYCLRSSDGTDTEMLRRANERLSGWDGRSVFKSGYLRNDHAVPPYYFEVSLYPTDSEGRDFVGIAQDVTQAFERESATRSAMEMATRSNEAKSRFLSNMSHDIRTPMNAIMNMTNFALENIDRPDKLGPYLHTIRESSEHLLHLINDVLDMSRIESGQTVVASAPFKLLEEIQRQADIVRPLCAARSQTLITDFSGLHTESVSGDALKLAQIIMNLLSNAVKFTPDKGAVRFTAREIPSLRSDMVDVRFTVEDNGIGIPEADRERIFEPFCRASNKRVGRIEGTGLGLSICKSYVDAMGGSIRCESEEGEGSTFTVELFFQKADAAACETAEPAAAGDTPFLGLHCLVVEDNVTNRLIAKALLERVGFMVDFAEDGAEGVQTFLEAKPGTYDIVYMDIQMPVMDGYQATMRIRESAHPQAKTVPIVAMTANAFAEDIEKARVAGMDAYLGKPVLSFDLIEQTAKAIKKARGRAQ